MASDRSAAPLAAVAAGASVGALARHLLASGSMGQSEAFLALPATARVAPPAAATASKVRDVSGYARGSSSAPVCNLAAASAVLAAAAAAKAAVRPVGRHQRRRAVRVSRRAEGDSASQDDGPELTSELGVDYSKLRDLLKEGDFKAADAESRRVLIEMAGTEAVKRGWVYFAEVRRIPETDMDTLNDLWGFYSKGKFGFVPQRKIWKRVRGQFDKFAEEVDWFTDKWKNRNWPDEFIYTLEAPVGHLPLTNCIRGAQVLTELMNHPAFEKKRKTPTSTSSSSSSGTSASKPSDSGGDKPKRSAMSMLAEGGVRMQLGQAASTGPAAFAGSSATRLAAPVVRSGVQNMAVATADVEVAAVVAKLEDLEELKEARQKGLWENPVDGGAMNERAWKTVAEQKAKQVLRQLKDRGLKELIEFKADLIEQGKVDALPSTLNADDLMAQQSAVSERTSSVEREVRGKQIAFEIFFSADFKTKGGWWLDVEVTYQKTKTNHRVIVGKDFSEAIGEEDPREVVKNAFAVLLARKVPMHTEGMITSEVFPVNYFTATNVATQYPEFLDLCGANSEKFDWERAQWGFKQIHDYSQDDKRTMPSPLGGVFDPLALQ